MSDDPATIASVEDIIRRLDPQCSPSRVDFLANLDRQLRPSITGAAIAAALGSLALLLAAIGTLGVFAYVVNERMSEIGVRLALGARAPHIVGLLAARMSWALAAGLVAGFGAALIMVRLIAGALHGLSAVRPGGLPGRAHDPQCCRSACGLRTGASRPACGPRHHTTAGLSARDAVRRDVQPRAGSWVSARGRL